MDCLDYTPKKVAEADWDTLDTIKEEYAYEPATNRLKTDSGNQSNDEGAIEITEEATEDTAE